MGLGLGGLAILMLQRKLETLESGVIAHLHRAAPPRVFLEFDTSEPPELSASKGFETVNISDI